MRIASLFVGLVCVLLPLSAVAEEVFRDVQYVSGHAGMEKKVKGMLTLAGQELRFEAKDGKGSITIPLAEIVSVTNSVEQNPGSTGAKLMLGVFASKKEEFLYVNIENQNGAEALIFKTKDKTSPAMVAKITFQMKKAAAGETAGEGAAPNATAEVKAPATPADSVPAIPTAPDSVAGSTP